MRTIAHTCTSCGHVDRVEMALGYICPTCAAGPGSPCTDTRYVGTRAMVTIHPSRRELAAIGAGTARRAVLTTLRAAS